MEVNSSIQLAQVFADLDTLQNTDYTAAYNLLTANKALSASHSLRRKARQNSLPDRPKFDALGKRITAPSLSRMNSSMSGTSSKGASGAVTPLGGSPEEEDEDLRRASELVQLFEMRSKFQEMGDSGLGRAKERVERVMRKHAQRDLEERERVAKGRYLGVQ